MFMNVTDGSSLASTGVRTIAATVHAGDDVTELEQQRVMGGMAESVVPDAWKSSEYGASQSYRGGVRVSDRAATHGGRRRGHVAWASSPSRDVDERSSLEDRNMVDRAGQAHPAAGVFIYTSNCYYMYSSVYYIAHQHSEWLLVC